MIKMLKKMQEIQRLIEGKKNRSVSIDCYYVSEINHCHIRIQRWFNGDIPENLPSISVSSIDGNAEHRLDMMIKYWDSL